MNAITRRTFVKTSLAASAAFSVLPGGKAASPNEKIRRGAPGQLHRVRPLAPATQPVRRAGALLGAVEPPGQCVLTRGQPETRVRCEDGNVRGRAGGQSICEASLSRAVGHPREGVMKSSQAARRVAPLSP